MLLLKETISKEKNAKNKKFFRQKNIFPFSNAFLRGLRHFIRRIVYKNNK